MILIRIFNNGAIIKGHSTEEVCSVVSYSVFAMINDLTEYDENAEYYTSHEHGLLLEGLTWLVFNKDLFKAAQIFCYWYENIQRWCKTLYPNEVEFVIETNDLEPAYAVSLQNSNEVLF